MLTQTPAENSILLRARACRDGEDCKALYKEWADTYNADLSDASQDYVAPNVVAEAALEFDIHAKGLILDAGCGTGLVGEALARGGATTIDGLDLSTDMLEVARKTGVYRSLSIGDLNQQIDKLDGTYDIVTCAGTFTHGHVGPDPALRTFIRLTKENGIIVATILEDIWTTWGFQAEIEKLEAENLIEVVSVEVKDYRKAQGDKARLVVLKKTTSAQKHGVTAQHTPVSQASQQVVNDSAFRTEHPLLRAGG